MSNDIGHARKTAHGIEAVCPTTGEPYISSLPKYTTFGGQQGVVLRCRHCDSASHTRMDRDFDQFHPHIHEYLLDAVEVPHE